MKRLLLAIGFVLLVLLVLGFIAPKEYALDRSILINAPKSHVYNQYINSLAGLHSWRSTLVIDSLSDIEYVGTPGTVGSKAIWKFSYGSREGVEEVKRVVPLKKIETKIRYIKPWESLNHARVSIESKGEGQCLVHYRFEGHNPFPFNIQHLFVDMDKKMGRNFEDDLARLKLLAGKTFLIERLSIERDQEQKGYFKIIVDSVTTHAKARQLAFGNYKSQTNTGQNGLANASTMPTVLVYQSPDNELSYKVVRALSQAEALVDTQGVIALPSRESLKALYLGNFKRLPEVHMDLKKHMSSEGIEHQFPLMEEYVVHPGIESDTMKWETRIQYPVTRNRQY